MRKVGKQFRRKKSHNIWEGIYFPWNIHGAIVADKVVSEDTPPQTITPQSDGGRHASVGVECH